MFLPEGLKQCIVAAKNISFGSSQIRDAGWIRVAWTQTAFTVASVLPKVPASPWRSISRLVVIIGDPKPAIGNHAAMGGGRAAPVQHLAQTKFAAVNPGIFSGALFDSLDERSRLGRAHRATRIMTVLFEIEHEQYTRPRFFRVGSGIDQRMRRTNDGEEMIGLRDRIRSVAKMIRAPQEAGLRRGRLTFRISPVALQTRKARFVNDTDDAFVFHGDEIGADQIVMRHVDDAVAGERREWSEQNEKNMSDRFHRRKVAREFNSATM